MTTKQKIEAALKEASVALSELQKYLGKSPEDKVLEKLDEIPRALQIQGCNHFHVCQPCTRPHYSPYWPNVWSNTGTTWTIPLGETTISTQGQQQLGGTYIGCANGYISDITLS